MQFRTSLPSLPQPPQPSSAEGASALAGRYSGNAGVSRPSHLPPASQGVENTAWLPRAAETAVAFEVCCNFLSNIHPLQAVHTALEVPTKAESWDRNHSPLPHPKHFLPLPSCSPRTHARSRPPSPCPFSLLQIVTGMESHSAKPFLSHLFTRWRVPRAAVRQELMCFAC